MTGFIAKQPNGKYCRFSNVVDAVTHYNFTAEEYINNITGTVNSVSEANHIIKNCFFDISDVISKFENNNMSNKEFLKILKEMCV